MTQYNPDRGWQDNQEKSDMHRMRLSKKTNGMRKHIIECILKLDMKNRQARWIQQILTGTTGSEKIQILKS